MTGRQETKPVVRRWSPTSAEVDLGEAGMISLYHDGDVTVTIGERVFAIRQERATRNGQPVGPWQWVVVEHGEGHTTRLVPR